MRMIPQMEQSCSSNRNRSHAPQALRSSTISAVGLFEVRELAFDGLKHPKGDEFSAGWIKLRPAPDKRDLFYLSSVHFRLAREEVGKGLPGAAIIVFADGVNEFHVAQDCF